MEFGAFRSCKCRQVSQHGLMGIRNTINQLVFATSNPSIALGLFVIAMALIPLNDSMIKLISDELSIFQILGVRAAFSLTWLALIPATLPAVLKLSAKNWLILSLRGFCLVGAMLFFFLPLATLTLAETTAIFFTAPLLIALLSVPVLGEKIGIYRILAVIIGLIGVIMIVKPVSGDFKLAYLMPMLAALSYAAFQVITRLIRNEAEILAMVAVQNVIYFLTGLIGMAVIFIWQPAIPDGEIWSFLLRQWNNPSSYELMLLALGSVIVLNLSFASTNVYSNVEATYVAPFEYVALPMAVMWGIVFWGHWPDLNAWIGILLIISAGIFMVFREHLANRPVVSSTPMRSAVSNTVADDEAPWNREYEANPFCF